MRGQRVKKRRVTLQALLFPVNTHLQSVFGNTRFRQQWEKEWEKKALKSWWERKEEVWRTRNVTWLQLYYLLQLIIIMICLLPLVWSFGFFLPFKSLTSPITSWWPEDSSTQYILLLLLTSTRPFREWLKEEEGKVQPLFSLLSCCSDTVLS